jgi:hypothetical protein
MIVGIMQPYFFPYIGYFQLMKAVDCFVFHDDVQYIKGGWINRNRILVNQQPAWLTLPVERAPHDFAINNRQYKLENKPALSIQRQTVGAYRDAPSFTEFAEIIAQLLSFGNANVAEFNEYHLTQLAGMLGLGCQFVRSSDIKKNNSLKGQDRVIDICKSLGATHYINPVGGLDLYSERDFADAGMQLSFLKARPTEYTQFGAAHVPFLSIIDVFAFNSQREIIPLLSNYETLRARVSSN